MKKKEKERTENNSKKDGKIIPNRKIRNCLDCDTNCKWILEANQTNHNTKNYKSKNQCLKVLSRVEVYQALQHRITFSRCQLHSYSAF